MKRLLKWLVDPKLTELIKTNRDAVLKENWDLLIILNILGTGLMAIVYIMTFIFPYMYKMRDCYTPYLILYIVDFVLALFLARRNKTWLHISIYAIALTTMAFGIELGVIRNPEANANLFMVFLIAVPLMFIERQWVMALSLFVYCAAFTAATYIVKAPAQYQTDITNCWVCFVISLITSRAMNKARMNTIETRRQLFSDSVTDALTGLPNRRSFNIMLREMHSPLLSGTVRTAVYIIDIDCFKLYNDTYGHLAGDECLMAIGAAFKELRSEKLHFFRFGGEEFVAVLTDDSLDANALGEKIVKQIYDKNMPFGEFKEGRVTVSVGGCDSRLYPKRSDVDLLNFADIALYHAKENGRNKFEPYKALKTPEILP